MSAAAAQPGERRSWWRRLLGWIRIRRRNRVNEKQAVQVISATGGPRIVQGRPPRTGHELGAGGQAFVMEMPEAQGFVYKEYLHPVEGARHSYERLLDVGERVESRPLSNVDFLWPTRLYVNEGVVVGYEMHRIPESFNLPYVTPKGSKTQLGLLQHALPDPQSKFGLSEPTTAVERLELAVLVARAMQQLHDNGVSYRDLSLLNIAFARDPLRIVFMDMDSARVITEPIVELKDGVDTPDWFDPQLEPHASPLGYDTDRYKLALLMWRLLVTFDPAGEMTRSAVLSVKQIPGIRDDKLPSLRRVFLRALGGLGARPPAAEWVTVLTKARA